MDVVDYVWSELNRQLDSVRKNVSTLTTRTERAETSGGVEAVKLANAPLSASGATSGDLLFISDGRKSGEALGAGTGVPAYYNPATNTWKRFEDNADVAI